MCLYPRRVYLSRFKRTVTVPCGKCIDCARIQQRNLSIRLNEEFNSDSTKIAFFSTFTYSDDNVPFSTYENNNGDEVTSMVLNRRDFQLFLKRLRKYFSDHNFPSFRVFYCGEYGPKTFRPHYHAIFFFSCDFSVYRFRLLLNRFWRFGYTLSKECDKGTSMYVGKYLNASNYDERFNGMPRCFKPFKQSPKHLGFSFLTQNRIDYYVELFKESRYKDIVYTLSTKSGIYRFPLPSPFFKAIFSKDQQDMYFNYNFERYQSKIKSRNEAIKSASIRDRDEYLGFFQGDGYEGEALQYYTRTGTNVQRIFLSEMNEKSNLFYKSSKWLDSNIKKAVI